MSRCPYSALHLQKTSYPDLLRVSTGDWGQGGWEDGKAGCQTSDLIVSPRTYLVEEEDPRPHVVVPSPSVQYCGCMHMHMHNQLVHKCTFFKRKDDVGPL